MTREEAIEVLRRLPIGLMDLSCEQKSDLTEALNIALAALCGTTREQVEKVWMGEWIGSADGYADGELVYDIWECSECGYVIDEEDDPNMLPQFCPKCYAAMTDEAVDIMLKRLEVMKDENRTD